MKECNLILMVKDMITRKSVQTSVCSPCKATTMNIVEVRGRMLKANIASAACGIHA
jgi:hypothetical protein